MRGCQEKGYDYTLLMPCVIASNFNTHCNVLTPAILIRAMGDILSYEKRSTGSQLYINTKPISVFSIIIKIAVYGRNISQLYCTKRPARSQI